jgi:class 3 adenylate cyclase
MPDPSAASAMLEGERKTVTALFADIKGSTEMMRDLDPEDARAIVDPAIQLMIKAVHRYDGYVVQSTGDGIFAVFGAPAAHEDHPQRALHAALATFEELRRAGELLTPGRSGIEVRIGINTGEVVMRLVQTAGIPSTHLSATRLTWPSASRVPHRPGVSPSAMKRAGWSRATSSCEV